MGEKIDRVVEKLQKVKHPWLEEEFQNALYKIS